MKKLLLLAFCLTLNSCLEIDKDQDQIFSYNDPFYLGINDLLANCASDSQNSMTNWTKSYDELLKDYRLSSFKIDFEGIANTNSTCRLIKTFEKVELKSFKEFYAENSTAMLVNIYNVLMLDIVSRNLNQTLEDGKPDLPENHSPLNIYNKGLGLFREVKWPIFNRYMSLDQVEQLISSDQRYISGLLLFRAMKGFNPLPEKSFTHQTLLSFYQESLNKYVNQEIFYDDSDEQYIAYAPGNLQFISNDTFSAQKLLRQLIYKNLDVGEWGEILRAEDILHHGEGNYKWSIKFNPVNWQLAK
ncbi:MAG: hypothetical protein COW00_14750 [Bdellovibrio sp. CG12_big_fil_rev_8_21_14_0_65_39_13]|nr:MAG: hypothetical protein COW78_14000 [Bdellovibrio sp. CG22_combo_CG10-13_8_21_14_all_39_27]PIQ58554.1 MAG: hypothetical protein COW00_14750 [Bdellovibrio sp. CG12_big_fil_rev_8_21_14_0_65_39_13]PIR32463.1 MAG: hypothetical protein COV37_19855 [Bdellovibrio sp. CG11_big_fil_rev_8_21_14_0_20_39_38]